MAQHRKYNIRSPEQLFPDREQRTSTRRRAAAQVFGLYLPLLSDIEAPLGHAVKDSAQLLSRVRRGPSAEIIANNNFGMTFAQHAAVTRNIRNMLGQGFVLENFIGHLQDAPVAVGAQSIEVPIYGFDWKGNGNRKLAAEIDTGSMAFSALVDQAVEIEGVLDKERGSNNLEVATPNHVTVARYGHPGDGMSLSRKHRAEVAERFHEIFVEHYDGEPLTLTLGSLVVGQHYNQPFAGMELVSEIPPFSEYSLDDELLGMDLEPEFVY